VCLSKSATEIVCLLIFQATVLDQLFGIKNSDAAKQSIKKMPHCSDFKDGGHFEYFTSIPVF
jgi:hypothetical protein